MKEAWKPFILSPQEDDWTLLDDSALRKKAQNRLAQRAHRKRFGRAGRNAKTKSLPAPVRKSTIVLELEKRVISGSQTNHEVQEQNLGTAIDHLPDLHIDGIIDKSMPANRLPESALSSEPWVSTSPIDTSIQDLTSSSHDLPSPFTDINFILVAGMTAVSALLQNARILSIPCDQRTGIPTIYLPLSLSTSTYPNALVPTFLQSTLPHFPYVDLLPFPSLRDRLLTAGSIVNCHEMWDDLSGGDVKIWGMQSWDERSWEVGERFMKKWWFLMDEHILKAANFWRGLRGEKELNMDTIKTRGW